MAAKFKTGDLVTFVNAYGTMFPEKRIIGFDLIEGQEPCYFLDKSDSPWSSIRESMLIHDAEETVLAIEGGHKIRHTNKPSLRLKVRVNLRV